MLGLELVVMGYMVRGYGYVTLYAAHKETFFAS